MGGGGSTRRMHAKARDWKFMTKAAAKQPSTRTKICMTKHVRKQIGRDKKKGGRKRMENGNENR